MSETTRQALDILIRILIYSGFVAVPIMVLMFLMYRYEKYKRWKDKDQKEAERILVKRHEDIEKSAQAINVLETKETELKLDIELLEQKKKELLAEIHEDQEDPSADETKSASDVTIKELHKLAKEKGIKGFSRMSKATLLQRLGY